MSTDESSIFLYENLIYLIEGVDSRNNIDDILHFVSQSYHDICDFTDIFIIFRYYDKYFQAHISQNHQASLDIDFTLTSDNQKRITENSTFRIQKRNGDDPFFSGKGLGTHADTIDSVIYIPLQHSDIHINFILSYTESYKKIHLKFAKILARSIAYRIASLVIEKHRVALIQEAAQESKAKGDFLAMISHEIRTPLNGIIGMAQLMKSSDLSATQTTCNNTLLASANILLAIVDDVMDLAKIESGDIEITPQPMNLLEVIDNCIALFAPQAEHSGLDFSIIVEEDVPIYIQSDPTRIGQMLSNYLSNAFKFTTQGTVSIRVKKGEDVPLNDLQRIQFSVQDTGCGLTDSQVEKLFQSFSKIYEDNSREYGGAGLGLTLVKKIAKRLGGQVGVNSDPGKGSVFSFDIVAERVNPETIPLNTMPKLKIEKAVKSCIVTENHNFYTSVESLLTLSFTSASCDQQDQISANMCGAYDFIVVDCTRPGKDLSDPALRNLALHCRKSRLVLCCDRAAIARVNHFFAKDPKVATIQAPIRIAALLSTLISQSLYTPEGVYEETATTQKSGLETLGVLVAEDNSVNRLVVKGFLSKLGVKPLFAENGQEACDLLCGDETKIDVVLMDCDMPILDGYAATQRLRTYEKNGTIPPLTIIGLSGFALEAHRRKALAAGMDDYLTKPIDLHKLESALNRVKQGAYRP
jgi:signal transduction histidine kinase/CheY-like chemotaxis protein